MKIWYPSLYAVSWCSAGTLAFFDLRNHDSLTSTSPFLEGDPPSCHQAHGKTKFSLGRTPAWLQRYSYALQVTDMPVQDAFIRACSCSYWTWGPNDIVSTDQARGNRLKHMQKPWKGWSRDCNSCLAWHIVCDTSHCSELNAYSFPLCLCFHILLFLIVPFLF